MPHVVDLRKYTVHRRCAEDERTCHRCHAISVLPFGSKDSWHPHCMGIQLEQNCGGDEAPHYSAVHLIERSKRQARVRQFTCLSNQALRTRESAMTKTTYINQSRAWTTVFCPTLISSSSNVSPTDCACPAVGAPDCGLLMDTASNPGYPFNRTVPTRKLIFRLRGKTRCQI